MKFLDYEVKNYVAQALKDLHFKEFSTVQKQVFDSLNKSKNLLVKSKTGSGKTHAFLIPIFNNLDEDLAEVQAVILSPTTELANQTYKVAQHIASFSGKEIKIKVYSGGKDRTREIEELKSGQPQIVIATPGKLKDLAFDENVLKIYTAKYYVIDEVDMVMDEGFGDDVDNITKILPNAFKMFFSATLAEKIQPFLKKYLESPIFIDIKDDSKLNIEHIWIPLKYKEKMDMLDNLLSIINPYICIIFCNKKGDVNTVYAHLKDQGKSVAMISGELSIRERKHILKEANDLKYQYIVASDVASRGIDIDGVSHIINYDLPRDFEFYLHRAGRTGRMNYTGTVYSFYKDLDGDYLDFLSKNGIEPTYKDIKGGEIIDFKGRNTRQKRVRPLNEIEKSAIKHIAKPTKVTPGYKKKRQKEIDKLTNQFYRTKNYKEHYEAVRKRKESKTK